MTPAPQFLLSTHDGCWNFPHCSGNFSGSTDAQDSNKDQAGLSMDHPHSPGVAQAALVHHRIQSFGGDPNLAPATFGPNLQRPWLAAPPKPQLSSSDGLDPPWLNPA